MQPTLDTLTSLRVAVTGHRDLDPDGYDDIRRAVKDSIGELVKRCAPARVELLTAMADGADQLVTDVAIECGCDIQVVLPKPYDIYRSELSTESAAKLDDLMARTDVIVSTVVDGSETETSSEDPALPYHRLGLYLAKTSHMLIAIWDGAIDRKTGGTLDVLACYLDRQFDSEPNDTLPDPIQITELSVKGSGPTALWVPSARLGSDATNSDHPRSMYIVSSGLRGVWHGQSSLPEALTEMLDDVSRMTVEAQNHPAQDGAYPLLQGLPEDVEPGRRDALDEIHTAYLAADRMAISNQSLSDRAFASASLIAAGMGFAFLWFAKIDDHLGWLYAYLVLFIAGYVVFRTARSRHWLLNHLSFRVLAETLRVRYFTALLGLEDRVDVRRVMAQTGVSSFPGFGWAREADRVGVPLAQGLPNAIASHSDLVGEHWVEDQRAYFGRKVEQLEARHERLELVQRALYFLSFLAVLAIITYGVDLKKIYVPGHVSMKVVLIFLIGLLPLWLTLWELHQGRMATRELLWQFRNQATIFERASQELSGQHRDESKQQIYIDLAERSLFETYLWTIHRFHREFPPPSGG